MLLKLTIVVNRWLVDSDNASQYAKGDIPRCNILASIPYGKQKCKECRIPRYAPESGFDRILVKDMMYGIFFYDRRDARV